MASAVLLVVHPVGIVLLVAGGAVWLLWALSALYLLFLALGAALALTSGPSPKVGRGVAEGRGEGHPAPEEARRFCALIPAHNEELLIGTILDRLHTVEYPAESYRVVVIADNCSDGTAAAARARGAEVLERTDAVRRGKGYALEWALARLLPDPRRFDAFLILDADSVLSANFLAAMNAALAQGHEAIQGRYDVLNVYEGWRTRLMACALALAHYVKPLGRKRWGLSDGLKGNGMCFSRAALERVAWSGESITEDIEYTLRLVLAGVRVEFAPEAVVRAQMPTTGRQAATQRQRWEGGRYALLKRAFGLLWQGIRCRRMTVVDRAVELIIPPFGELFALPVVFVAGAALWNRFAPGSETARWALWGWSGVLAAELVYLTAGLLIARVPAAVAASLLFAPFYIVWKLGVYAAMIVRRGAGGWNRTERQRM
jgi:1,2-diacylglycerol 3-beta-glucosyltransferase